MFAVSVQFLTGRYVATAHDDRESPEWPPHPARLFSALTAAWGDVESPDPAEAAVLERIERLDPPHISAPAATPRAVVTHFVPVNDPSVVGAALWGRVTKVEQAQAVLNDPASTPRQRRSAETEIRRSRDVAALVSGKVTLGTPNPLPAVRGKQGRTYPSHTLGAHPAHPDDGVCDHVQFVWPSANLTEPEWETLDGLLARVTRLGHSSSLVNCTLTDAPDPVTHRPDPRGELLVRTVGAGQLDALTAEHARHQGSSPRSLPHSRTPYASTSTSPVAPAPRSKTAGEWFSFDIVREESPSLVGLRPEALIALTLAWRQALEEALGDQAGLLDQVCLLGLPRVGRWGSGDLLGAAVALPAGMRRGPERDAVVRGLGRWLRDDAELRVGSVRVRLTRPDGAARKTLSATTWGMTAADDPRGVADVWASATPVAVPRPRPSDQTGWSDIESWIADACVGAGLPRPLEVDASTAPPLRGALPARRYGPYQHNGRRTVVTHATLRFPVPIAGPLLLGVGRQLGFGLFSPVLPTKEVVKHE